MATKKNESLIVLDNGFELKINRDTLNSWKFLKLLSAVEENPLKSVQLMELLLGGEQLTALEESLGDPSVDEMTEIIKELMEKLGEEVKN